MIEFDQNFNLRSILIIFWVKFDLPINRSTIFYTFDCMGSYYYLRYQIDALIKFNSILN